MMSEDISFRLSILKWIAIIAVVYIHSFASVIHLTTGDIQLMESPITFFIEVLISRNIAGFAVPLFFAISGYIFFQKNYQNGYPNFLLKKAGSLLWPYFLWNTICIAYMFLLQSIPFTKKYFTKKIISSWTFKEWVEAYIPCNTIYPYHGPLWFLLILFCVFIVIPPFKNFLKKYPQAIIVLIIFHNLCFAFGNFHFYFYRIFGALAFFCFGYLIFLWQNVIDKKISCIVSGFIFISLCIIRTILGVYLGRYFPKTVDQYFGIIFLFSFSQLFLTCSSENKQQLLTLSSFSWVIYLLHDRLLTILKKLVYSLLPPSMSCLILITFFILPICIVIFLTLVGLFLKRKLPSIYVFLFSR